jgi:hypothetical protein
VFHFIDDASVYRTDRPARMKKQRARKWRRRRWRGGEREVERLRCFWFLFVFKKKKSNTRKQEKVLGAF